MSSGTTTLVLTPGATRAEEEQALACARAGGALLGAGAADVGAFAARVLALAGDDRAQAPRWAVQLAALSSPLGERAAGPLAALYAELLDVGLDPARLPVGLGEVGAALAWLRRKLRARGMCAGPEALSGAAQHLESGRGAAALAGVSQVVLRGFLQLSPAVLALARAISIHRPVRVELLYDAGRPEEWPLADRTLSAIESGWDRPGDLSVEVSAPARPVSVEAWTVGSAGALGRAAASWVRDALDEGVSPDALAVVALRPEIAATVGRALAAAQLPLARPGSAPPASSPAGRLLLAAVAGSAVPDRALMEELLSAD